MCIVFFSFFFFFKSARCSEEMVTEGTSPVVRTTGDKTLEPNAPWIPDENQKQLIFTFPRLSEVTGIQLIDENVDNSFYMFYKAEGSNKFVPFNNGKGKPEVRSITFLKNKKYLNHSSSV